jgi:dihydrofolate reductase
MGRIVVAEYLSVDGVGEDPGAIGTFDRRGWILPYFDDELAKVMADQLVEADGLLLGRRTYEGFIEVWPPRAGDPIGDRMNALSKLVVSRTLNEPLEWNATLLDGDVDDEVRKLRGKPGGNLLVYGSGELVRRLMDLDVVDALQLMVVPVTLGSGRRFFGDGLEPRPMALTAVRMTGAGVVVLTYRRAARDADQSGAAVANEGDWFLNRGEPAALA